MVKGIDVSYHNGVIDWKSVKNSGIEFAIIRAGYGKNTIDKKFIENIVGANTAGLDIGIYWFIYATNEQEAIANANMCDKTIKQYKSIINLKVWADWEYDSDKKSSNNGVNQTKKSRTSIVKAFLGRLQALGYDVGNYANPDYLNGKFEPLTEFPLWLAKYSSDKGNYNPFMWQYSSSGVVPGINGKVDLNILYGNSIKKTEYYPVPEFTLIDSLNKIGVDSSYKNRVVIASVNGIENYTGTEEQNLQMLEMLNSGTLIK